MEYWVKGFDIIKGFIKTLPGQMASSAWSWSSWPCDRAWAGPGSYPSLLGAPGCRESGTGCGPENKQNKFHYYLVCYVKDDKKTNFKWQLKQNFYDQVGVILHSIWVLLAKFILFLNSYLLSFSFRLFTLLHNSYEEYLPIPNTDKETIKSN